MHSPFEQFKIKNLFVLELSNTNISFTNSSLCMVIAAIIILGFFYYALRNTKLIPDKMQLIAESIYEFVDLTITDNAGIIGRKYFPIIFSTFLFILLCNLLGMVPYSFTVTSHIAVTFALAIIIFLLVTIIGFIMHGTKFLHLFLPAGTPTWLAPLMILIELFSYLSRPISLSVRLAGNMIAGHVLLKVMAGFVIMMGAVWGILPMLMITLLTGFEIFVAILQAYIFTVLSCVYLNDALNLH